jgi:hypothetical protein
MLGALNPRATFPFRRNSLEKLYVAPKLPEKPENVLFNALNWEYTFGVVVGFGPVYNTGKNVEIVST